MIRSFILLVVLSALLASVWVSADERPPWATDNWEPVTEQERKPATLTEIDQAAVLVRQSQGVDFMTGGLGAAERAWMDKHGAAYAWKMVFSKGARGGFVSGVAVRILDKNDQTVFKTTTDGPWLLVDLPAGVYQAQAEYREQVRSFSVTLDQQQRVSNVNFD